MDTRSETSLTGVHPDLVRVVRSAALLTKQRFMVIHGLRTVAEEAQNVAKGASQTMHSRHLPNADGLACAVDLMAVTDNLPDWKARDYQPIAAAMFTAAHNENVLIEWGGDWKTLKDWGHFQLPWRVYP